MREWEGLRAEAHEPVGEGCRVTKVEGHLQGQNRRVLVLGAWGLGAKNLVAEENLLGRARVT